MRRILRAVLVGAAGTLAGGSAGAVPFGATLGVSVNHTSSRLFVAGEGSGSSQPLGVGLAGGIFAGSDETSAGTFAKGIRLEVMGNGAGSFTGTALNGALPLRGRLLFEGLRVRGMTTLLEVPLSIPVTYGYQGFGVGGSVTLRRGTSRTSPGASGPAP